MMDARVSLFRRADLTDPVDHPTLASVLEDIRAGRWAAVVEAVRTAGDKDARDRAKLRLPAVTFGGKFSSRRNDALVTSSGYVQLDYDGVQDVDRRKALLMEDPHVAAVFRTASGAGLRVLVPVTPAPQNDEQYKQAFAAVRDLFYEDDLDGSTKDVARLSFVSVDPDLYVNRDAEPVPVTYTSTAPMKAAAPVGEIIPNGERNETLASIAGTMRARGLGRETIEAALLVENANRCRPPLSDEEVRKIAESVSRYKVDDKTRAETIVRRAVVDLHQAGMISGPKPEGGQSAKSAKSAKSARGLTLEGIRIPREVYDHLPNCLHSICSLLNGIDRDVFLTGSLPVLAGAAWNVRTKYSGHWQSLNQNVLITAPAGSGKAKMRLAQRLGDRVHERVIQESEDDIQRWELDHEEDSSTAGPKPGLRQFYLAGDSSAASFKEALSVNPHGVVFETEIKSLSIALRQDWGDFSDTILKGFHNEPITSARKGQKPIYIQHPAPSFALSGTPGSIFGLIPDTEDGRYSRFAVYTFESDPVWIDQFEDEDDESLSDRIEDAAGLLDRLHLDLSHRDEPLYGRIDDEGREIINSTFGFAIREITRMDIPAALESNVKRCALIAIRAALTFTLLREFESGVDIVKQRSYTASAVDVTLGTILALVYLEHAIRLSDLFVQAKTEDFATRKQNFLAALPDGEFETADAITMAEDLGIPERTAKRYLKSFTRNSLIERLEHGTYRGPRRAGSGTSGIIDTIGTLAGTLPEARGISGISGTTGTLQAGAHMNGHRTAATAPF